MKKKIIKLDQVVVDKYTGVVGVLTHFMLYCDGSCIYHLKPLGLNKDTKEPFDGTWVVSSRIDPKPSGKAKLKNTLSTEMIELPIDVLGTKVKHKYTGITGFACSIEYHINGCIHIYIQQKGTTASGCAIKQQNFDVRELTGSALKKLSVKQKKTSVRTTPSPCSHNVLPK